MKLIASLAVLIISLPIAAQATTYRVLSGGEDTGHLIVNQQVNQFEVSFDSKQNGRGPTIAERIVIDERGFPTDWIITGKKSFGSAVDEYFRIENGAAHWQDTTGTRKVPINNKPLFYVDQNGSVFSRALIIRALLDDPDGRINVYPAGEASYQIRDTLAFDGPAGTLNVTAYEILGLALNPELVLLDQYGEFFAVASPRFSIVREGYETTDKALRAYAEKLSTDRFTEIQSRVAHTYDAPVRIRNVHIFEPQQLKQSRPKDVVVYGQRIASIQPADSSPSAGEIVIDGAGGTLVPGMYEMHGHIGQQNALLNIAAGVTSVRDMGNENAVLEGLIGRINRGEIAGPRITRSCFIEGKSEFSAATGETVATLEEAMDMVRWCGSRGFHQVKLYNSMRPEWAKTLVEQAHSLGMRVAGHVPAFSTANAMIEAGFDEITHANQLMLGWVLNKDEDTRTLFRFTAMKRFGSLEMGAEEVRHTFSQMLEKGVAHDPTIAIHEQGMTAVDGIVSPIAQKIIENLPTSEQRSYRSAMFGAESPEERAQYIVAFQVILETLTKMNADGILLLPGTDLGGSFAYHRELELFEKIGLTPAEVLRRASYDMADYLNQVEDLGSIEKGKYADFFLVPGNPAEDLSQIRQIRMVVSDGVVYFPSEIYPSFGIRPFTDAPGVTLPGTAQDS